MIPPSELTTSIKNLVLKAFSHGDIDELHNLIQKNRSHLTAHGNYEDLVSANPEELKDQMRQKEEHEITMGLRLSGNLIGTVSLIRHKSTVFGLGYWIDADYAGHGYITEACRVMIAHASQRYRATEIWAGITATNTKSIQVVSRLGLKLERIQPTHLSYKLDLTSGHGLYKGGLHASL